MKRVLSIIMVVIMLVTLLPRDVVLAQELPHFDVSSAQGNPGEQITVTVELKDSPGFGGMAYDVCYDNAVLRLVSYELGLGSNICTDSGMDTYPNKMNFQYAGTSNITGDGVLVSFVFEIISAGSCTTEIKVVPEEGTTFYYEGRNEVDFSLETAAATITVTMSACDHSYGQWVTVVEPTQSEKGLRQRTCTHCGHIEQEVIDTITVLQGDVNGDGRLNVRDARTLLRYIAGLLDASEIELAAADYNGDGRINVRDARAILRSIAGLD